MNDTGSVFLETERRTFHFNAAIQNYIFYMVMAVMCSIVYKVYNAAVASNKPKNIEQVIADNVELACNSIANANTTQRWINAFQTAIYYMKKLNYAFIILIVMFVVYALNREPLKIICIGSN